MATITAQQVKTLRERTGAGMMECKKALVATDGDLDAAAEHLRKSGAAKADKKAGRVAADGRVVIHSSGDSHVIVEVNSETDFVAKDENFEAFSNLVARTVASAEPAGVDELMALEAEGSSLEAARTELVSKVGENITVRRFEVLKPQGEVGSYSHGTRIGVLVDMTGGDETLAKDIAMHIAAVNPAYLSADQVPADVLDKEKQILIGQAESEGKPPEIVEKMVQGRINKYLAEITLLGQPFVKDQDIKIDKLLAGAGASVNGYVRFEVGEGIEKKQEDFASEVMAQVAKG